MLTDSQVGELLAAVSAVDNREVTEPTVRMWRSVLEQTRPNERAFTYGEAWAAIPRWYSQNEGYLSPRGLIAEIRKMREEAAEAKHHEALTEDNWRVDPEPVCRDHGLRITNCVECCIRLHYQQVSSPNVDLHSWAVAFLYRDNSEPF
jgi:hypothetical protein